MFRQFLLYSKVTHKYILFLTLFIMFHHLWLDIVPSAIQQDLTAHPFQRQQFASINPIFPVHPTPFPLGNHKSALQVHELLFCGKLHLCLYIRFQICDITWCLSFSFWLTSLSMRVSSSIHVVANGIIIVLFYGWVIFHCVHIPRLLNPIICPWTSRLFSCLGYCEQCCNEHAGACVFFFSFLFFFVCLFAISWATPMAYGRFRG